jgi:hypothetical protein
MKLTLPRYIYGMLQTPDKKNVYGNLQPIAYSREFSGDLQREVYQKVRPGLSEAMLHDSRNAYGFFALSGKDFIIAHYELMDLTEPTSRGRPLFSEYLHITSSQLADIGWNLYPVFKSFTRIQYYEQIVKDIPYAEIEFNVDNQWLDILRQFPVQVEAILVRYLSSSEKINITSSPDDQEIRLRILCSLFQCLPQRYRKDLSFATLAKDTSDSVRVFFSAYLSGYGQVIDWSVPTIPNLAGVIYANWAADLVRKSNADEFRGAISKLVLPTRAENLKTLGDELDLAIKFKEWYANRDEYLKIKVVAQLKHLAKQINEFSCIFTSQEAEAWLSFILIYVMKLTAYDIGVESLSHYIFMIADDKTRQELVRKIVGEIFIQQKEENLRALAGFIAHISEYGVKTNQNILVEFCKEIMLQCLASKNCPNALRLWENLKHLGWVNTVTWFQTALNVLQQIETKEDFVFIVSNIGCPVDTQAFEALLALLKRSPALSSHLPENIGFLETQNYEDPQGYLNRVSKCFLEVNNYQWLSIQIRFGYENLDGFLEKLPFLTKVVGINTADNLLKYVISANDDLLTVLVTFSTLLNQIQQGNSEPSLTDRYLASVKKCRPENIGIGLEILQKHWEIFSVKQLELMFELFEQKPRRYQNINRSVMEIRTTIQKKNRIKSIQDVFSRGIKKNGLGYIIFDFVSDFSRSADVDAWVLFEKYIQDCEYSNEYHGYLMQILLENQFFKIEDNKLKEMSILLGDAGLTYESDIFIYWLFFRRGIYVNPISTIGRTLNQSYVLPSDAGIIIGQEYIFDKKYISSLAKIMVQIESIEAEKLIEKLDVFVSGQATNSFENRLIALVSDLAPDVIWIENCRSLSKYIKSELTKLPNRRK